MEGSLGLEASDSTIAAAATAPAQDSLGLLPDQASFVAFTETEPAAADIAAGGLESQTSSTSDMHDLAADAAALPSQPPPRFVPGRSATSLLARIIGESEPRRPLRRPPTAGAQAVDAPAAERSRRRRGQERTPRSQDRAQAAATLRSLEQLDAAEAVKPSEELERMWMADVPRRGVEELPPSWAPDPMATEAPLTTISRITSDDVLPLRPRAPESYAAPQSTPPVGPNAAGVDVPRVARIPPAPAPATLRPRLFDLFAEANPAAAVEVTAPSTIESVLDAAAADAVPILRSIEAAATLPAESLLGGDDVAGVASPSVVEPPAPRFQPPPRAPAFERPASNFFDLLAEKQSASIGAQSSAQASDAPSSSAARLDDPSLAWATGGGGAAVSSPPPPPPPPPQRLSASRLLDMFADAKAVNVTSIADRRQSVARRGDVLAATDGWSALRQQRPHGRGLDGARLDEPRTGREPAEAGRRPLSEGGAAAQAGARSALELMMDLAEGRGRRSNQPRQRSGRESLGSGARHRELDAGHDAGPTIALDSHTTLTDLARLLRVDIPELEQKFTQLGEHMDSPLDAVPLEAAELICSDYGVNCEVTPEVQGELLPRPPVVTILGHVDHGKTTLLDRLRDSNVAAGEAGGITQHIGAFSVTLPSSNASITFLDTPGHAAFSAMRSRGARVTDVAVLVVAADDGVKPQTREAIEHARAAGCPIVVALTKCDRDGANPGRVRQQLLAEGIELEEAGGSVQVVETAATTGLGMQDLEEAILLQAELLDLRASTSANAEGTVVEASLDVGQGPLATVVMQSGCLRVGQAVVVGKEHGRVRAIRAADGQLVAEALPGMPVRIAGLRGLPHAGDQLRAMRSEERAVKLSEARSARYATRYHSRLEQLASDHYDEVVDPETGAVTRTPRPSVSLVIVADVDGSLEALTDALLALNMSSAVFKVASASVGRPSLGDVALASSSGATLVTFGVAVPAAVKKECERLRVELLQETVIYRLLDVLADKLLDAAPTVEEEVVVGRVDILASFEASVKKSISGSGKVPVAGCRVVEGHIRQDAHKVRILRMGQELWIGRVNTLRQVKQEVSQVGKGSECGVMFEHGWSAFQVGDKIEVIALQQKRAAAESPLLRHEAA